MLFLESFAEWFSSISWDWGSFTGGALGFLGTMAFIFVTLRTNKILREQNKKLTDPWFYVLQPDRPGVSQSYRYIEADGNDIHEIKEAVFPDKFTKRYLQITNGSKSDAHYVLVTLNNEKINSAPHFFADGYMLFFIGFNFDKIDKYILKIKFCNAFKEIRYKTWEIIKEDDHVTYLEMIKD